MAIYWRGLVFETRCTYLKISPLPHLGHVYYLKRGGGDCVVHEKTVETVLCMYQLLTGVRYLIDDKIIYTRVYLLKRKAQVFK